MSSKWKKKYHRKDSGFSLLETIVGITILALATLALFSLIDFTLKVAFENKAKATAASLAVERLEFARNLPYTSVGIQNGIPSGPILPSENIVRNGITFTVSTSVLYVDDPFDGIEGGSPNDILAIDYKKIRVEVAWNYRLNSQPVIHVATIVPKGLESDIGGGTIDLTIFDAFGLPVPQANVNISNNLVIPAINIDILSSDSGKVIIPGAPTSTQAYEITTTKSGFSTDQTYSVDPVNLPSPAKQHLTIFEGKRTQTSFSIDLVSSLNVKTVNATDSFCDITQSDSSSKFVEGISSYRIAVNDWWDTDWLYRRKITFDNLSQTENLLSFPVLIYLNNSNFDFTKAQAGGGDVRFTNEAQGTEVLDYEIESWDSIAEKAYIWVKVPQIDANSNADSIWVYYGNSAVSTTQNSTSVWATNYESVWHIDDDFTDSTGNHLTAINNGSTNTSGISSNGQNFISSELDYIDTGFFPTYNENITFEGWFRALGQSNSGDILGVENNTAELRLAIRDSIATDADGENGEAQSYDIEVRANSGNIISEEGFLGINTDDGNWHYLVLERNGATGKLYYDGDPVTLVDDSVDAGQASFPFTLLIGAQWDSLIGNSTVRNAFNGDLDEIRTSKIAHSDDWVKATYLSITGSFVSFGLEETNGPPIGSINIYISGDAGSDLTGNGSPGNPYQTISRGLQDIAGSDGDTIHIKGGLTYSEDINITSTHSGTSGSPTTIKPWVGTGQPTINAISNGVYISGSSWVTVTGLSITSSTGGGILVEGSSDNITLSSHLIQGVAGRGILVRGTSDNIMINNNLIYETGNDGIKIESFSNSPKLIFNTIDSNSGTGIYLDSINGSYLRNNILSSNTLVGIQGNNITNTDTDYNVYFGNSTSTAGFIYGANRILLDPLYVDPINNNYHLQSITGYYPFNSSDISTQQSPGVDRGDPLLDYNNEPLPNGCRVNIGAFGNTSQASRSLSLATPIPNISFNLKGSKTIGTSPSGLPVLKYHASSTTDILGEIFIPNIEWDSYYFNLDGIQTGYDIAYIDPPIPLSITPNTLQPVEIGLVQDSDHSLLITVIDSDNQSMGGVDVQVENTLLSYDETIETLAHGQSFFSPLSNTTYVVTVTAPDENPIIFTSEVNGYTTEVVVASSGTQLPSPPLAPVISSFSNITETSLTINWVDNATNELGYRVYRSTVTVKPTIPIASLGPNTVTYTDSILSCGTTYYYWIEAYNTNGTSEDFSSQTILDCSTPPITPIITDFTGITESTITINWLDNATDEDGYRVFRDITSTKPSTPITTISMDSTNYTDSILSCGTTYYYWIEAYNTNGTSEDFSSQTTINCVPVLVFQDTFSDVSNMELSLHIPDLGSGWTHIIGVGSATLSTKLTDTNDFLRRYTCGGSEGALYQTNNTMLSADYEVRVLQINGDVSDDTNIIVGRLQDVNNMYALKWNESTSYIYKRVAGAWIQISEDGPGIADGSIVTLKLQGNSISAMDDSVLIISITDSDHSGAGKAGIGMGGVIIPDEDCSAQRLDDFEVYVTN